MSVLLLLYIAVETEADAAASESKTQKEAIDLKELKRIDHILTSLKRKVICFFVDNNLTYYCGLWIREEMPSVTWSLDIDDNTSLTKRVNVV
jgi:hypothetical protein